MPPRIRIGESSFQLTASIGIALSPHDGSDVETLVSHADIAMYHAKEQGGRCCCYYDHSMNERLRTRIQCERRLAGALERNEFEVYYQPQFKAASGELVGAEALVRWNDPEHGLVEPSCFIGPAEDSGLIIPLGRWVLRAACRQAVAWQAETGTPMRMAVNLSARQFAQGNLVRTVERALGDSGLSPGLLDLELTESTLMNDMDDSCRSLERLKDMGIRLSVDDFGTGYSSLSYLAQLAVDALKIDRSFLQDVPGRDDHVAITHSVISLARTLGLKTVGEGVEAHRQADFLRAEGCDELQGFLLGRPVPSADFPAFRGSWDPGLYSSSVH